MAGSTFQPPIHLDPNQDSGQQTAFINQNFQSLAAALEANSFRIVQKSNLTIPASSSPITWTTVPHGLPFIPIVWGFLNNSNVSGITTNGSLPLPTWLSVQVDNIATHQVKMQSWVQVLVDATNVYGMMLNGLGSSDGPATITYYLLQETAN